MDITFNITGASLVIVFLCPATGTGEALYANIFAPHEELFLKHKIGLYIMQPTDLMGFYVGEQERLSYILSTFSQPYVLAGGSMGAFGALYLYLLNGQAERCRGLYLISPPMDLVYAWEVGVSSGDPTLIAIAERLFELSGGSFKRLKRKSPIRLMAELNLLPLTLVMGFDDEFFDPKQLPDLMDLMIKLKGNLVYIEGSHALNWSVESLVVFAAGLI